MVKEGVFGVTFSVGNVINPRALSICMEKQVRIIHQKEQNDFSSNKMERDERVPFAQS